MGSSLGLMSFQEYLSSRREAVLRSACSVQLGDTRPVVFISACALWNYTVSMMVRERAHDGG